MKWGQRFDNDDEVPEELRGKSPTEIVAALKKAQADAAKTTEIEEARVASEQKAAQLEADLVTARAKVTELEARPDPNVPPPPPDEPPSPWTDPEKFVDSRMQGVAGVALQSGMMTAEMYFVQQLSGRDQKIYRKYKDEVVKTVNTFNVQTRVMPQSWFNAFIYVKGLHDLDIQKAESSSTDFFSETPSRGEHHEEPPADTLTDEEKAVCKAMHWSEEGYLKQKKQQVLMQSSKGSYARYPVKTTT